MVMENFGIICGVTLGLFGSVFSVVQFFYQRYKDKEQAVIEAARDKAQAERDKAQDLKDRLAFLMQVIIDKDIPRESRQPFFDEYIAKGGNGTVIKFWLENK
ncbi:hypothetical protein AGMMS49944_25530 [Spirochaetia bacterium]|nr:hypothetical protein AGMMS49944_25530 [Spirochaetia bacterium]